MADMCCYCDYRGDIALCKKAECSVKDSWYVRELVYKIQDLNKGIENLIKENNETLIEKVKRDT